MSNNSKGLTGIAGVYFVAAELSQRGYIATLTLGNTDCVDILASNIDGSKIVSIQVKTNSPDSYETSWHMSRKHENISSLNLFYVFVHLNGEGKTPNFYIVPSEIVAKYVKEIYPEFRKNSTPENIKKSRESDLRFFELYDEGFFKGKVEKYHNKWENLGLK